MRVLFVAHGPAHVPWLVPLCWAAQLAGHDVRVAARRECVDQVTRAGLVAVSLDNPAAAEISARRLTFDRPAGPAPERCPGALAETVRIALAEKMIEIGAALAPELIEFARDWGPDLVVHDTAAVAGPVTAAAIQVPAIGHTWGIPVGMYQSKPDEPLPAYAQLFADHGAEPPAKPETWIDPCPPSLRAPCPIDRVDMRFVPYSGPGILPGWLARRGDRPRVLVTAGVTTTSLDGIRTTVLNALGALGVDLVLAVTGAQRADLGDLPPGTRVLEQFPLNAVLPGCDAIVHHGGLGTGMVAATLGVPQVVVPQNPVQKLWAETVALAGLGLPVPAGPASQPDLVEAVRTALDAGGSIRARAGEIAAEIARTPAPADLIPLLESAAV